MKSEITAVVLVALLSAASHAEAPINRGELAKKLSTLFGHKTPLPAWCLSPDAKIYASGDMFFYDVEKKLTDNNTLPLFGIAMGVDTGEKYEDWKQEDEVRMQVLQKFQTEGRLDIAKEGSLSLADIKQKVTSTPEEQTAFDGLVKQLAEQESKDTKKLWLKTPGFSCVGWLDNQSAVFYRAKDIKACAMVVIVDIKAKSATAYLYPEKSDTRQFNIILSPQQTSPDANLVISKVALPAEAQKLLDTNIAPNQARN